MSSNSNLTAQARTALKGRWQDAIFLSLLYFAVCVVSDSTIIGFLLVYPICVGFGTVCLKIVRQSDETAEIKDLFMAFSSVKRLSSGVVAGLVISLIVAIGYFLFIIPGIYLSCRYAMTYFVLADNEDMSAFDAMKRSADIMDGRIWKFFCLNLRFAGWWLLCIITLGIGFIFLKPYLQCSFAAFYDEARTEYDARKAGEAFIAA